MFNLIQAMRNSCLSCLLTGLLLCFTQVNALVSLETVNVADIMNLVDPDNGTYGRVDYVYQIGRYEVTNAQYIAFLNAVDPNGSNSLNLYNTNMGSQLNGGIILNSTADPGAKYSVRSNKGQRPVNYVSAEDAMRFANWVSTGQGSNSDSGAYDLANATMADVERQDFNEVVTGTVAPRWYVANVNEWYKAAYYSGSGSTYFTYATGTNTTPTAAAPSANPSDNDNRVNYNNAVDVTGVGNLTIVGAYQNSQSPYQAFDMSGNVMEWTDDRVNEDGDRPVTGGAYNEDAFGISKAFRYNAPYTDEGDFLGFRLVLIPEPGFYAGCLGLLSILISLKRLRYMLSRK